MMLATIEGYAILIWLCYPYEAWVSAYTAVSAKGAVVKRKLELSCKRLPHKFSEIL
ncbi:hypothetical protein DPMN_081957 [Dreissena polymorpha]|uniref:Uncharacterized protein n=1 Tax=Dreissena polymorpha TaxID=45954 RepID=A0A9D3Y9U0_DREPO|nr:hypothetical protein DPMN_081957 [Dreissena polymorpha]